MNIKEVYFIQVLVPKLITMYIYKRFFVNGIELFVISWDTEQFEFISYIDILIASKYNLN